MIIKRSDYKILESDLKKLKFFNELASQKTKDKLLILCNKEGKMAELVWGMLELFNDKNMIIDSTTTSQIGAKTITTFTYAYEPYESMVIRGLCDQIYDSERHELMIQKNETPYPGIKYGISLNAPHVAIERLNFDEKFGTCFYYNSDHNLAYRQAYDELKSSNDNGEEPGND